MPWQDFYSITAPLYKSPAYKPPKSSSFAQSWSQYTGQSKGWGSTRPKSSGISWNDLASGRLARTRASAAPGSTPSGDMNPLVSGVQEKGLERFQLAPPVSSAGPRSPYGPAPVKAPNSTKGDLLGSIAGSFGSIVDNLDFANFIPYFMENVNKAAHQFAGTVPGAAQVAAGTDVFQGAVQAASDVVAPVGEALHNWIRDSQLGDKAKLYRGLMGGDTSFGFLGPMDNPFTGFLDLAKNPLSLPSLGTPDAGQVVGQSISRQSQAAHDWQEVLLHSVDPQARMNAKTQLKILADSIDIPESVKNHLAANPNASDEQISKWFDEAPEGRAWSYEAGPSGILQNLGNPLAIYGLEAYAGYGAAASVGGLAVPLAATERAGATGSLLRGLGTGIRTTGTVGKGALKLMTGATSVGLGAEILPLTAGAISRYQGDDAAVKWWDEYNQPGQFASNPNVQFMTSFAVNPFHVVPGTGKILMQFKHGGAAVLDRATGDKLKRLYTHNDLILDRIQTMYGLGSREEAATALTQNGWTTHDAYTHVVDAAAQVVLKRLPDIERLRLTAETTPATLLDEMLNQRYGNRIMAVIEKEPEQLRAANLEFWNDRLSDGPFNPDAALDYGRRYRQTSEMTAVLRSDDRTVLTRRQNLPPEAAAQARTMLDEVTVGDSVAMRDWQMLQARLPMLGRFSKGIVRGDAATLKRADLDRVIELAEADFATSYKRNPVGTTTGHDPILDPNSGTPTRDVATAVGTSEEVIAAIQKADVANASEVEMARRFVLEKADLDVSFNVNKLEPEQVFEQAARILDETTLPWRRQGERIAGARDAVNSLRAELVRLWGMVRTKERDAAIADVERQIARYEQLVDDAVDPKVPFTAAVANEVGTRTGMAAEASRMRLGHVSEEQRGRLWEYLAASGQSVQGSADDLLKRVRDFLKREDPEALRAPMMARAERIVAARTTLERVHNIDLELDLLGGASTGLFSKVQGQWMYSAGKPHLSRAFRARMAKGLENAGEHGVPVQTMSDYDLWVILTSHQERATIIEQLTPSQRRVVETNRGRPTGPDEYAASAGTRSEFGGGSAEGMGSYLSESETWQEQVIRLIEEREGLLSEYQGSRMIAEAVAGGRLPKAYLDAAEASMDDYGNWLAQMDLEHQRNVARVATAIDAAISEPNAASRAIVREIVMDDPQMAEVWAKMEADAFDPEDTELLMHTLRKQVVPDDFVPPKEGLPDPLTPLDEALLANDPAAVDRQMRETLERTREVMPIKVPKGAAAKVNEIAMTKRASTRLRKKLENLGADLTESPSPAIIADPANRPGLDVLSVILHGTAGHPPATLDGVVIALREIENGNAARRGIGGGMLDEGARVAKALLNDAVGQTRREVLPDEVLGMTNHGYFPEDEIALTDTYRDILRIANPDDPLTDMTYALGRPPSNAVLREWGLAAPGLAEEFISKRFQPFEERVLGAHVRQLWNLVFGPKANAAVRLETRQRFIDRLGRAGIGQDNAAFIWKHLHDASHDSRQPVKVGKGLMVPGDFRLYADVQNIPNGTINGLVWGVRGETKLGAIQQIVDGAMMNGRRLSMSAEEEAIARGIDYADTFRESSSWVRRTLADSKLPLGEHLAQAYGMAVHNKAATTFYYWFRFMLDPRFHAMNALEAQFLYLGMAGLKRGEFDEGLLGQASERLRNASDQNDLFASGSYPFSRPRHAWAYKTFVKLQPDALRRGLKVMQAEDDEVIQAAFRDMIEHDPDLADQLLMVDGKVDPTMYLAELDKWHEKMLGNIDATGDERAIMEALAAEREAHPEMMQVFDRLELVNKTLWDDIRKTFYGNPSRSQAERLLNSWILFWPLSYQIKSTKWFLRVLMDRAGGLPTNAGGAWVFNEIADTHNRLLATDPEYQDWFAKHRTLVRTAQMFFPVSLDGTGVTLNPLMRAIFVDSSNVDPLRMFDVGPVYSVDLAAQLKEEVTTDLYPALKDLPVLADWFRPRDVPNPPKPSGESSLNPFGS